MDNKDFSSLQVWQKAHELSLVIYHFVKLLPPEEKYRFADQTIRSSRSVPANVSEGYGRFYYQDNISFCRKARGSLDETRNHLMEIKDLKLLNIEKCDQFLIEYIELRKILNGYIRYLKEKKPGKNE